MKLSKQTQYDFFIGFLIISAIGFWMMIICSILDLFL
jgi:hypothetical protein